jgi:hypothetical protein
MRSSEEPFQEALLEAAAKSGILIRTLKFRMRAVGEPGAGQGFVYRVHIVAERAV